MSREIEIAVEQADVTAFQADVLALKYAQGLHGADEAVAVALARGGASLADIRPMPGEPLLVAGAPAVPARQVLFIGTPRLSKLSYLEVRKFATAVLTACAERVPSVAHLALTLHGSNVGLDESQAFASELRGLLDAFTAGVKLPALERITFVEKVPGRAQRMRALLEPVLGGTHGPNGGQKISVGREAPAPAASGVGLTLQRDPEATPHIFVAMPFSKETDDIFYYGIQKPIHAAGRLCERIDHSSFTGDIVDRLLKQIESAELVVADLTGANPNVYLEVGYAWGKGRPTLLLARGGPEALRFDVRGHRCIFYERIIDLETALTKELARLGRPHGPR